MSTEIVELKGGSYKNSSDFQTPTRIMVTRFWGGILAGVSIQLTICGSDHICLDNKTARKLAKKILEALDEMEN